MNYKITVTTAVITFNSFDTMSTVSKFYHGFQNKRFGFNLNALLDGSSDVFFDSGILLWPFTKCEI